MKICLAFPALLALITSQAHTYICDEERKYLAKRQESVEHAQDLYTGRQLQTHPKIGFCLSGGSSRSQICSLGFISGSKKTGLLPSTTHQAALSGSTWDILPLLTEQYLWGQSPDFLTYYRQNLQKRLEPKFLKNINLNEILKKLAVKLETYGSVEPADIWGALLADRFMGNLKQGGQNYTLATIRALLKDTATYPFPMFSAIIKETFEITGEYEWFEINPFVSGCHDWDYFVPTQYVGSTFEDGQLIETRPEESLGFLMGVFGSPYDLNIGDLFRQLIQMIPESFEFKYLLLTIIDYLIKKYHLDKTNFLPSPVNNPAYKLASSPYREKYISLADAGIDFDLPVAPLLERKTDIIICCDASSDAHHEGFPELKMAARYARTHGFKFPALKYYDQIADDMFVFKYDEYKKTIDKTTPIIIYLRNPVSVPMSKMQYSKEEFDEICDYMQAMVIKNRDAIAQVIIEKSEQLQT